MAVGGGLPDSGELLLSYGDKANTELLYHYGFVDPENPHDAIGLPLPCLPRPGDSEEVDTIKTMQRAVIQVMAPVIAALIEFGVSPSLSLALQLSHVPVDVHRILLIVLCPLCVRVAHMHGQAMGISKPVVRVACSSTLIHALGSVEVDEGAVLSGLLPDADEALAALQICCCDSAVAIEGVATGEGDDVDLSHLLRLLQCMVLEAQERQGPFPEAALREALAAVAGSDAHAEPGLLLCVRYWRLYAEGLERVKAYMERLGVRGDS